MTDVDAITRLLDLGFNAVLLYMLYTVYRDFQAQVKRHTDYLEKLVDELLPPEEQEPAPPIQTTPRGWSSRTPTNLNEPAGARQFD